MPELIIEDWEPIRGYEGIYDISSLGRVWSIEREIILKVGSNKVGGRLLTPYKKKDGYMVVGLSKDKLKLHYIHRLVADAFLPYPVEDRTIKYDVNHKDLDKSNNELINLEWMTHEDNLAHARELGVWKHSFNPITNENIRQKLTPELVLSIRDLWSKGVKQTDIALQYGVSKQTIWNILNGRTWKVID